MPPTVKFELGLGSRWNTEPSAIVWYDLTSRVRDQDRVSIRRLRSRQSGQIQSGQASLTFDNRDGWLNPKNKGSPYYDLGLHAIRGTPLRMRGFYGPEYPLFWGFVDGWDQEDPNPPDRLVRVSLSDAISYLPAQSVPAATSFPSQSSGARINAILDLIGWPAEQRDIETGKTVQQAVHGTGAESALKLLERTTDTENGVLFVAGDGRITLQGRHHRSLAPGNEVKAIFGGAGGLPYQGLRLPLNRSALYNVARVTREGGSEQTATNPASIRQYGRREMPGWMNLWMPTNAEAANRAGWETYVASDEDPTIDALLVKGRDDEPVYPEILGRQIGDRIRVVRRYDGDLYDEEHYIEAGTHDFSQGGSDWQTTWPLTPAKYHDFAIVGQARVGISRVGY